MISLDGVYRMYGGISMLDHTQLDKDKLLIRMTNDDHPDKLFERMYTIKKKYANIMNVTPTMP